MVEQSDWRIDDGPGFDIVMAYRKSGILQKCAISNQRPRITFDENGVCSACNFALYKRKILIGNSVTLNCTLFVISTGGKRQARCNRSFVVVKMALCSSSSET